LAHHPALWELIQMPAVKLVLVAGARPNFMKLAPLMNALRGDPSFHPVLVHTGQHYDEQMSGQFFRELDLPAPDYNLEVGSGSHAQQTAEIMKRFEPVFQQEKPDAVVVVGDVNSTMACALVAKKLQGTVIHIEAGLRSFDRSMPEEINRMVTDAISDLLLVSEQSGRRNLLAEGIPEEKIHFVGNLMIDSLRRHLQQAQRSSILTTLGIGQQPYAVLTMHRPANVDDPRQFAHLAAALGTIAETLPVYFPVHPRTRERLQNSAIALNGHIHLIEPLGYLDFLCLISKSAVILTDSGGVQEESTVLGVPCLTLRDNTERPATVEEGTNIIAGTSQSSILMAWERMQEQPKSGRIPKYWDGQAAARCLDVLRSHFLRHSDGTS
jgi:UDP-N-acetylglucosamine 2-epimerase (non-hydrolysing)